MSAWRWERGRGVRTAVERQETRATVPAMSNGAKGPRGRVERESGRRASAVGESSKRGQPVTVAGRSGVREPVPARACDGR